MAHTPTIFDSLIADHRKHRALLEQIDAADAGSPHHWALFEEFTLEVKGHAAAEEQAFYSTIMRKPKLTDETRHSVSEHKEIEDLLNELAATDPNSDEWEDSYAELRHQYLHHIDEEEEDVFPAAAQVLSEEDERHMRSVFERRKAIEKDEAEITPEKEHQE